MAKFTDLPDDILKEILDHVLPADLENFVHTSKHIAALSSAALHRHRVLIQKYSIAKTESSCAGPNPAALTDLLRDPIIGHYVRHFKISDLHWLSKVDSPLPLFQAAVGANVLLSIGDPLDTSHECSDDSFMHPDALPLVILLAMFPNLTALTLHYRIKTSFVRHNRLYRNIVKDIPHVISKLRDVRLKPRGGVYCGMEVLRTFAALPSVRRLEATSLLARDHFSRLMPNDILPPFNTLNITHLYIWRSQLASIPLCDFLESFQGLKVFECSFIIGPTTKIQPQLIRNALHAHAATLQRFTLRKANGHLETPYMDSLCEFEVLKELQVEFGMLFDNKRSLSDTIPYSLRTLTASCVTIETFTEIVELVAAYKAAHFSELKGLTIATYHRMTPSEVSDPDGSLGRTCKAQGVLLDFVSCQKHPPLVGSSRDGGVDNPEPSRE